MEVLGVPQVLVGFIVVDQVEAVLVVVEVDLVEAALPEDGNDECKAHYTTPTFS